jgi:hypothetical protein
MKVYILLDTEETDDPVVGITTNPQDVIAHRKTSKFAGYSVWNQHPDGTWEETPEWI